jgi:hypothetical protein
MGICFFCPNGHPLNVKAELAGKIGLCPKCRVKMRIPTQSMREINDKEYRGQPTAEEVTSVRKKKRDSEKTKTPDLGTDSANAHGTEHPMNELIRMVTEGSSRSAGERRVTPQDLPSSGDLLNDPNVVWFVTTSEGQRYGPAKGSVLKEWINERRVGPKALVLRSGWKTPLEAGQVFPETAQIVGKNGTVLFEAGGDFLRQGEGGLSLPDRNDSLIELRKRQRRAVGAIYLIVFLTFILLCAVGILIWILLKR